MESVAPPDSSALIMAAAAPSHLKRKRSPSHDAAAAASHANAPPAQKAAKTSNHLAINYLARQYGDDLPLVSTEDNLPSILALLGDYHGVLERHESLACNLGAKPLGPILIKRFERLFDGPPRVLKCHGKDGTLVTWLDVVEFARNKPEQFALGQMSEGARVCQFYTKQCRVQISEEDYQLISSGIPQKLIPPQPIIEDEEKELGTLEILEKNLSSICHLADQVAARTRQLNHRIKARKQAILDRRSSDTGVSYTAASPTAAAIMNDTVPIQSAVGFVAVNARQAEVDNNKTGVSSATRHELMTKFFTLSEKRAQNGAVNGEARRMSSTTLAPITSSAGLGISRPATASAYSDILNDPFNPSGPQSAGLSTPANAGTFTAANQPATVGAFSPAPTKDDGGPFKAEMVARMESLKKGDRVMPPCDRCRRLHMDCMKNLTACTGCTKKHAKCSWKDVREHELRNNPLSADASDSDRERNREASVGFASDSNFARSPPNGVPGAAATDLFSTGRPGAHGTMAVAHDLALDAASAANIAAVAASISAAETHHDLYGQSGANSRPHSHQGIPLHSPQHAAYRLGDEGRAADHRVAEDERDRSSITALIA